MPEYKVKHQTELPKKQRTPLPQTWHFDHLIKIEKEKMDQFFGEGVTDLKEGGFNR